MKKQTLTVLAAGSLAMSGIAVPVVFADESNGNDVTVEERANSIERSIKDAWLDGKLETALLLNEHLNSFAIDTEVKHGVAVLRGAVESDIDRDLAGEIAQSIEGVSKVENDLVVDKQKSKALNDSDDAKSRSGFSQSVANATLTARIKTELLANSNTAGLSIDVDSESGQVTLSGDVDSSQEKELAAKIAENARGAQAVVNKLNVKSSS